MDYLTSEHQQQWKNVNGHKRRLQHRGHPLPNGFQSLARAATAPGY